MECKTAEKFEAAVQYEDWEVSAVADSADLRDLHKLLTERDLMTYKEFPIGIQFYVGEHFPGNDLNPSICVVIVGKKDFDSVEKFLNETPDPVPVRVIDLELTTEEFFGLFKRFSISISRSGLEFNGREYQAKG
jgi:hypothetical protein